MKKISYVCPETSKRLFLNETDVSTEEKEIVYSYVIGGNDTYIPNFLKDPQSDYEMYSTDASVQNYRNFLNWLFETFNMTEEVFRASLAEKLHLKQSDRVLITGCGIGDDVMAIMDFIGETGCVCAVDLSKAMVVGATHNELLKCHINNNLFFSICDAHKLPFENDYFDAAFHFGGINLFADIRLAIEEMNRVVKPGGRVLIGDEGCAPWLKTAEYGRIAINNNRLWDSSPPLDLLPATAMDVHLSWTLGNCFYVIDFEVSNVGPYMNIDVPHKGWRGGSMRTRYFGQLEGVTPKTREKVIEKAKQEGISVHEWLEKNISKFK
jgi:SAM-dependent methyltransferase